VHYVAWKYVRHYVVCMYLRQRVQNVLCATKGALRTELSTKFHGRT